MKLLVEDGQRRWRWILYQIYGYWVHRFLRLRVIDIWLLPDTLSLKHVGNVDVFWGLISHLFRKIQFKRENWFNAIENLIWNNQIGGKYWIFARNAPLTIIIAQKHEIHRKNTFKKACFSVCYITRIIFVYRPLPPKTHNLYCHYSQHVISNVFGVASQKIWEHRFLRFTTAIVSHQSIPICNGARNVHNRFINKKSTLTLNRSHLFTNVPSIKNVSLCRTVCDEPSDSRRHVFNNNNKIH